MVNSVVQHNIGSGLDFLNQMLNSIEFMFQDFIPGFENCLQ